jgi:hypothetical protein
MDEAERLKPAIAELLRTIPETWAECNLDSLPPIQTSAFCLLLAAGMVERRGWARPTIANHPAAEGGFARVVEAAVGRAGEADNRPAIHAAAPLEWRLTADGTLARNLLGSETQAAVVFDFVLKLRNQPFSVPGCWIRIADDKEQGRHLAANDGLATPPWPDVVGEGRLFAVRKLLQPATPAAFAPRNFMQAFDKLPWVKPKDPAAGAAPQPGGDQVDAKGSAAATPTDARKATPSKRRGRKKADYRTIQKEAAIAEEWARARDAGEYKVAFAKRKGMKREELDALLDRVRKRKSPSE